MVRMILNHIIAHLIRRIKSGPGVSEILGKNGGRLVRSDQAAFAGQEYNG